MPNQQLYIGLMSGTSADAVDAVLVDLSNKANLLAYYSQPLSPDLRSRIHQLTIPSYNEIDQLGVLDVALGQYFAQAANKLLDIAQVATSDVLAIGSHGQTVRHRPPGTHERAFTLQIGDPNTIAELTGITTVADFRRRDMAAGGQGAPLVPAFHRAIFQNTETDRVIVNIGGMANITWLPKGGDARVIGFDTGPGNVLMDGWIYQHLGVAYDQDGNWAGTGKVIPNLVSELLDHPFFAQSPPKSTGRESFHMEWLHKNIEQLPTQPTPADVQASLLELTAISIADSIQELSNHEKEVYICGGGAYNASLMRRLEALLPNCNLTSTTKLGISPQWIEAMAFAWLAQQTLSRKKGNLSAVTGATHEVILGGIYLA